MKSFAPSVSTKNFQYIATKGSGKGSQGLFSLRPPRDASSGFSSGFKNIGKGLGAGLGALVAAPVAGYREAGAKGLFGGLVGGIIGASVLIGTGVTTGVAQMGRGIAATPSAIGNKSSGKDWDEHSRTWIRYNLPKEKEESHNKTEEVFWQQLLATRKQEEQEALGDQGETKEDSEDSPQPIKVVKEMGLYDILDVPADASGGKIKKAYFIKARKLHPDKNPNDPTAHAKFQQLSNAYQVLSDPSTRASYDSMGAEGVDGQPKMDGAALFSMIFGSELFMPLVGEMKMATAAMIGGEEGGTGPNANGEYNEELMEFKQWKREVACAVHLAELLDRCAGPSAVVDNNGVLVETKKESESNNLPKEATTNFEIAMRELADELSNTAIGGALLGTIGYVYTEQAVKRLGGTSAFFGGFKQQGHIIGNYVRVASSGVKAYGAMTKMQKEEEQKKTEAEEKGETYVSTAGPESMNMEVLLETLWNATVLDIEDTLRRVCYKVLRDQSVPRWHRMKRTKALKILGELFAERGQEANEGIKQVAEQMNAQMGGGPDPTKAAAEATPEGGGGGGGGEKGGNDGAPDVTL